MSVTVRKYSVIGVAASVCVLFVLVGVGAAGEPEQNAPTPQLPTLSGDQGWVSSIPVGLQVYVMSLENPPDDDEEGGWVTIEKSHDVFAPENLKGTTPLVLDDMPAGWIAIGLRPVTWLTREAKATRADPTLQTIALVTPLAADTNWINRYTSGEGDLDGGIVYATEFNPETHPFITILATDVGADLSTQERDYPSGSSYVFDDEAAVEAIDEKIGGGDLISPEEKAKALELAHRGGKVMVDKGDTRLVVEVLDLGEVDVHVFINVSGK